MKFGFKAIKLLANRGLLKVKAASPEIMLGIGIVCGVGAIVTACIASRKVDKVVEEIHEDLDILEEGLEKAKDEGDTEKAQSYKKEIVKVWAGAAWKFAKLYGPTLFLTMASGASILTSHGILKKRYLTTAAAYKALDEAYKAYRENVETQFGLADGEKALAAQSVYKEADVENENGEVEKVKGLVMNPDKSKSPYEFDYNRFTAPSTWDKSPDMIDAFLRAAQEYFTHRLNSVGHVFLNEVLDYLGLERTTMGQLVGWMKGAGDDYVDFGYLDGFIKDYNLDSDLCTKNVRLNFNCDGIIYDMLRLKQ